MQDQSEAQRPSILIVDDTPENIDVLKEALKDQYSVRPAINGTTALKIANATPPPDLILLDIMMPGMDGYEVMRRLQAEPATRDIPVIFITALADMENEIKGLEAGAVDYITKPFNPPVVRTRVATHLALRQARRTLEIRNEDLLQERMLVEDIIIRMRSHQGFDDRHLRYLVAPVDRTNGDILLSAFTPDGRQRVLVGDFTGHGLPAAVGAPLVAHVFYEDAAAGKDIEITLVAINDILCRQFPTGIFMAGCMVEIFASRDNLRIWSAGLPECILLGADGLVRKIIPPTGFPPFGIMTEIDVVEGCEKLPVVRGERLYIYSDGITETRNPSGEFFELTGVERFIAARDPAASLDELVPYLEAFHGSSSFHDDITFVEVSI